MFWRCRVSRSLEARASRTAAATSRGAACRQLPHPRWGRILIALASITIMSTLPLRCCFGQSAADEDYSAELPRLTPLAPKDALASFELLPGYRLEQTAAEPLVVDPVAMSFDASGRLYVAEMRDYSEQETESLGRVRLLIDEDSDGIFDNSHVFAENLSWPTAILCYDGGVFVGAAPDLMYLKDTDGDGVADVRTVVFTGFGRGNVQGLMNSLRWGLDNRVHGATSSAGGQITRPDDPSFGPVELRGRDFSFDPRRLDLRAEAGGGQHGMCFDRWGRKFVCSNSDHAQAVLYPEHRDRPTLSGLPAPRVRIADDGAQAEVFRISPVEPWRIVRTRLRVAGTVPGPVEGGGRAAGYFTGATGITIYEGDALPELRGQLFVNDVGSNIIHRKRVQEAGVSFVASRIDRETEIVRSKDIWFRPVQLAHGPDGCLHILDMYREVIEHPKSLPPVIKRHLDLTSGRDRGRLYRLVPDDASPPNRGHLDRVPSVELVELLGHDNSWQRETAARLLYERRDPDCVSALESALEAESPLKRLHAMALLPVFDRHPLLLSDPHPRVREYAALRAGELDSLTEEQAIALADLARDNDARVVLVATLALPRLPDEQRFTVAMQIVRNNAGGDLVRTAALVNLATRETAVLQELLADSEWRTSEVAPNVLSVLVSSLARARPASDSTEFLTLVSSIPEQEWVLRGRMLLAAARANPEWNRALSQSPQPLTEAVLLTARTVAQQTGDPQRLRAIELLSLSNFATDGELLNALLHHQEPLAVQQVALRVLGQLAQPQALEAIVERWSSLSPQMRAAAEEIVFAREAGAHAMLDALEREEVVPSQLSPSRVRLLRDDPRSSIRNRARSLLDETTARQRQEILERYQKALTLSGDAANGRGVFRKNCSACHRLEDEGYEIGPNLLSVRNRGRDAILVNLFDPNREVNPQYLSYVILTEDGRSHTGMIQSETASTITLLREKGETEEIPREDISVLRATGVSLMPEGLEKQMTVEETADLLAYLDSLQ